MHASPAPDFAASTIRGRHVETMLVFPPLGLILAVPGAWARDAGALFLHALFKGEG